LKEKVKVGTTKIDPVNVMEASMLFIEACKNNTGNLVRIESQLAKLTKQVAMLACLSRAELLEDQPQAKRQVKQNKPEAKKGKEKQRELKKADKMKKEQKVEKKK